MTDEQLAADELTRYRAGIEQLREAGKSQSRHNLLDRLSLVDFCDRLLDPVAFAEREARGEIRRIA
jgi:hypothetical protein